MATRTSLTLLIFVLLSCNTPFHPTSVQPYGYQISGNGKDSVLLAYLAPFRDSMSVMMNEVVGHAARRMDIRRPVSTLGNFLSDAYLETARAKFDAGADISVMKFGGIRRPYIEPGPITRGMIFEVMPFDNLMVLVTVKGDILKQFLAEIAAEGAGVAGFTMNITGKQASEIMIGGKPLEDNGEYTIVYSDYNYNNAPLLQKGQLRTTNYLIRDAIEDYVRDLKAAGRPIGEDLENRLYVRN